MRRYLVDFSTLASANKGLHLLGGYLSSQHDTEGLTELLDLARVVDLVVLSDSLVTSHRVSSYGGHAEIGRLADYVSLSKEPDSLAQLSIQPGPLKAANDDIHSIERLMGLQIVYDFTREIERDLTDDDYAFVQQSSNRLAELGIEAPNSNDGRSRRSFYCLVARTIQYLQTADVNGLPYVCHNFRAPIVRAVNPRLSRSSQDLYRQCETALRRWLTENFGDDRLEFSLPMFFLGVVKEARHVEDIFKVAHQFRDSKEAVRIRELLSEITDESGALHLLKYAELRRVAQEETTKFKKKFAPYAEETPKGPLGAEISATPTSVSAKVAIDVLKLSKDAVKWFQGYRERRSVAVIFKTARDIYEVLSIEQDLQRLWNAKLTPRHREILREVQRCCDPPPPAATAM